MVPCVQLFETLQVYLLIENFRNAGVEIPYRPLRPPRPAAPIRAPETVSIYSVHSIGEYI